MSSNQMSTNTMGTNRAPSGLTQAELDAILANYPTTPTPLTAGRLTVAGAGNTLGDSGWSFASNRLTLPNGARLSDEGNSNRLYYQADLHYFQNLAGTFFGHWRSTGLILGSSSAPARRLHVLDTASPQMRLEGSGGAYGEFEVNASGHVVATATGSRYYFNRNGDTESFLIDLATNNVVKISPGFAVGLEVVATAGTAGTKLIAQDGDTLLQVNNTGIGAFGVTPVARQVVPTGSTADQIITALQNLGWFAQS